MIKEYLKLVPITTHVLRVNNNYINRALSIILSFFQHHDILCLLL